MWMPIIHVDPGSNLRDSNWLEQCSDLGLGI